jgi:hypothetical protein
MEILNRMVGYIYNQNTEYIQSIIKDFSFKQMFDELENNAIEMTSDDFSCCITLFTDLITCRWLTKKKQHKEYLLAIKKENFINNLFTKYEEMDAVKKINFITFLGRGGYKNKISIMVNKLDEEFVRDPIICQTIISEVCWLKRQNVIKLSEPFLCHNNYLFKLMIIDEFENQYNVLNKSLKYKVIKLINKLAGDTNLYVKYQAQQLLKLYAEGIDFVPVFGNIKNEFYRTRTDISSLDSIAKDYLEKNLTTAST